MEIICLDKSDGIVTREELQRALNMPGLDEDDEQLLEELVKNAAAAARPKAAFMYAGIDETGDDYCVINGIRLSSRLVSDKIAHCRAVYPYLATCGRELRDFAAAQDTSDVLIMLACDMLQELYLRKISEKMFREVKKRFTDGTDAKISHLSPGSLEAEWQITEQIPLFRILGDIPEELGVELNKSCLMLPEKSVSGIYYSSTERFESCMHCTRSDCPNRRAKYKGGYCANDTSQE